MHTVQLKLDDSIYDNVMFLLNNLKINLKGMEIKEIEKFSNHSSNLVEEWKDLNEDTVWK